MGLKNLIIFGTGEIGRLARYYFDNDSPYAVVGFTADDRYVEDTSCCGLPLVPFSQVQNVFPPDTCAMHVALSYAKLNQTRAEKYYAAKEAGYNLASYVCSRSVFWDDLEMGDNCFILENQTIQPTVAIGSNVMIWSGNHIGHGSVVGDHTYISSHVCLSGHSVIGTHCFFGVNSATKDFIAVGDRVFVTMGSIVTADVEDGGVVLGAKGDVLQSSSPEAIDIKRKYFYL